MSNIDDLKTVYSQAMKPRLITKVQQTAKIHEHEHERERRKRKEKLYSYR